MSARSLTDRDLEILEALTLKVRLLALRQLASHWWNGELANARRRMRALAGVDLVERITVSARTLPPVEAPIATWQSGQPAPAFGSVAQRLQSRWLRRAVRPVAAYIATARAAQLLGGRARGELKHPLQAAHDLGLAAVWLCLRRRAPRWAAAFRSEDLLAHTRRAQKCPDAFIVDKAGVPVWAIEFGGSYDTARVRAFHEDCARRELPYQIW